MLDDPRFSPAPPLPAVCTEPVPFERALWRGGEWPMHVMVGGIGPTVVLVHGNPTWGWLWRRIGKALVALGLRVVIPDLVGFGLSAKPVNVADHTLDAHVRWTGELVDALAPDAFAIVGQDWGGPIAAGVAARRGARVRAAVFGNTAILVPRRPLRPTAFHRFSHVPFVSELVFRGCGFPLPVLACVQGDPASLSGRRGEPYRAPFPGWRDRAGPLALARMVPDREGHPSLAVLAETDAWSRAFKGPVGLIWGLKDPILGRGLKRLRERFPQAEVIETQAGHFLQEEVPGPFTALVGRTVGRADGLT